MLPKKRKPSLVLLDEPAAEHRTELVWKSEMDGHSDGDERGGGDEGNPFVRARETVKFETAEGYNELPEETTLLSLSNLEYYKIRDEAIPEFSIVAGPLLGVKYGTNKDPVNYTYMRGQKKALNSSQYQRMFVIGSMQDDKGRTFCLMEKNVADTHRLWSNDLSRKGIRVGERLAIMEPSIVGELKSGTLIIDSSHGVVHLTKPNLPVRATFRTSVQSSLRFFILKRCIVHVDSLVFADLHCTGTLCDRQAIRTAQQPCGCYNMNALRNDDSGSSVMQGSLNVVSPAQQFRVDKFRSLRTTSLLFSLGVMPRLDLHTYQSYNVLKLVRGVWRNIEKAVNDDGGWTVIGWFLRGNKQDAGASATTDTTSSEDVKYHVVYVFPTRQSSETLPKLSKEQIEAAFSTGGLTDVDSNDNI